MSFHNYNALRIGFAGKGFTFHPKLHIFHLTSKIVTWIGSANLTESAFNGNVELVAEFEDQGEAIAWFDAAWQASPVPDDDWLHSYQEKASLSRPSAEAVVPQMEPPTDPFAAPFENWPKYLRALRILDKQWLQRYDSRYGVLSGENSYVTTIEAAKPLFDKDWSTLSESDAKILLGLKGPNSNDYGLLGAMSRALTAKNTLLTANPRNLPRRQRIVEALREVIRSRNDKAFLTTLRRGYEAIDQLPGFGEGVTSRLLALAKPDVLVSVNNQSIEGLSKLCGIPTSKLKTPEGYIKLIQWVMNSEWWKSPRPKDPGEARIWQVRAALLDGLVYNGEHFEREGSR